MARNRNGRFNATYRDRNGDVQTTPTFSTAREADDRAHACRVMEVQGVDAGAFFAKAEILLPYTRRGHVTVAGYGPDFLAGHRLEDTSRESYGQMLRHVYAGLGTVCLRDLDAPKVRAFVRSLEASELSGGTVGAVMTVLRRGRHGAHGSAAPKNPALFPASARFGDSLSVSDSPGPIPRPR